MPALLHSAVRALAATSSVCPTSPTCPQDDQCAFTANGVAFQVSCATDFYGGDLSLAQTPTLDACMLACSNRDQCVSVSYVGQNCYMKSTLTSAQSNPDVIGAAVTSRETISPVPPSTPSVCPNTYSCPQDDGCIIQGGSRNFVLSCGADYYGGDLTSMYAASLRACTQACADNDQCVAASFVGGQRDGQCYLKDKNNGANSNSNVDAVAVDTRVVSSTTTTASSTSSSTIDSATSIASSNVVSSATTTSTPVSSTSVASTDASSSSGTPSTSLSSSAASTVISTSDSSLTSPSTSTITPTSSIPSSTPTPTPTPTSSTSFSTSTPTPIPTPTNILRNPGFEDAGPTQNGGFPGADGWVLSPGNANPGSGRTSNNPHTGQFSYQATGPPVSFLVLILGASQTVTVVPGQAYQVTAWTMKSVGSNCSYNVFYNNRIIGSATQVLTTWSQMSHTIPAASTQASASGTLTIRMSCGTTALIEKQGWIDDVSMIAV